MYLCASTFTCDCRNPTEIWVFLFYLEFQISLVFESSNRYSHAMCALDSREVCPSRTLNERDHHEKWRLVFNRRDKTEVNKCNQLNNNTMRVVYRKSLPVTWAFSDESRFICKVSVSFIDPKATWIADCIIRLLLILLLKEATHSVRLNHDEANQIFHSQAPFLQAHAFFLTLCIFCFQTLISYINLIPVHFIWFLHFKFDIDRSIDLNSLHFSDDFPI